MFITVGWLLLVQWPTIQSNMILCPSALVMAQLWCKDMIFRLFIINLGSCHNTIKMLKSIEHIISIP